MISIMINVDKINKDKLYKGEKGTYLNAVLIPTPNSQYGDYMVVESISKEEREAGGKGVILGNGKKFGSPTDTPTGENKKGDLPF